MGRQPCEEWADACHQYRLQKCQTIGSRLKIVFLQCLRSYISQPFSRRKQLFFNYLNHTYIMAEGGTQLTGNFRDCGPNTQPQLDYVCQGPSCNALDQFPFGDTVNTAGSSLNYKSSLRCELYNSPYFGPILFEQKSSGTGTDSSVSQDQNITLSNRKGLQIFSDGTSEGTNVNGFERTDQPDCALQPSQSSSIYSQGLGPSIPVVCNSRVQRPTLKTC